METAIIFGLYVIFWTTIIGALIYLIIRRIKLHKTEDFEKRNN